MIKLAANLKDSFSANGPLNTVGNASGFNTAQRSIEPIAGTIISVFLSLLGVVFLILMIYGGYMWMSAAGNDDKVSKAQSLIKSAVLGLIVVVAAYAITIFVISRLTATLIKQ